MDSPPRLTFYAKKYGTNVSMERLKKWHFQEERHFASQRSDIQNTLKGDQGILQALRSLRNYDSLSFLIILATKRENPYEFEACKCNLNCRLLIGRSTGAIGAYIINFHGSNDGERVWGCAAGASVCLYYSP